MKIYVVSAMLCGEMLGCLGAYTTRKKAEERIARFKSDVEENYGYGEDVYPETYAEIAEVEVDAEVEVED